MGSPLLLNGVVDTRDEEISRLRRQLAQLDEALRIERIKNGAIESGITELRHITRPLLMALSKIHGLVDEMGIPDGESVSGGKWDAIKKRFPPRMADAVDILLLQGEMGRVQLAAALKMDYSNCNKNVIGILLRQGWLVENNRKLSLKQL